METPQCPLSAISAVDEASAGGAKDGDVSNLRNWSVRNLHPGGYPHYWVLPIREKRSEPLAAVVVLIPGARLSEVTS